MSQHIAIVGWKRSENEKFVDTKYSRAHSWKFDGGAEIPASASSHVVPAPYSEAANVDPEEAFVASLASCHLLWFLSIAAKRKFTVESYTDNAIGTMGKDAAGKVFISKVALRPEIIFGGERLPTAEEIASMHEEAHDNCFIANSVKTEVVVETK